jgi:5,5'-dehydrodivanillate O-demethylase
MLSKEANERLSQVGPGTPVGELLRRYWHPIATLGELLREPVLAVKLLGENLALYRTEAGELGLVSERCPHRGASLAYGIPEEDGLRCPYHGWKFSGTGHCLEQPAEPDDSTFKHRISIPAYPVQELGGLLFAYLGPEPVPLLPHWDVLVRDDLVRDVAYAHLPCNWLQIQENSLDPHHVDYLHNKLTNYVLKRQGKPPARTERRTAKIAFQMFEWGISKRRLWEGQNEDNSQEWNVGHPMVFLNMALIGDQPPEGPNFQWRVPVDDEHTLYVWCNSRPREQNEPPQVSADVPAWDNAFQQDNGRLIIETISGQDMMAWVTQGALTDRTTERLGVSD